MTTTTSAVQSTKFSTSQRESLLRFTQHISEYDARAIRDLLAAYDNAVKVAEEAVSGRLDEKVRTFKPFVWMSDGEPCSCGCNDPVATEAIEMLQFLSHRMKFAGVGELVANSYAKDIDKILAALPPDARL